jgi:predicted Zn-dependent protease
MSVQQYDQLISTSKLSTDAQATAMVKRVGEKIVQAVEEYSKAHSEKDLFAGYKWDFNLIQDPNVNAFAMPGGKVVVYTGILPVTQNETGLATVLGHEIAHVYAGHGGERLSQSLLTQMGEVGLSAALQKQPEQTKSLFIGAYGLGTQIGFLLPFSRVHESEADHLGLVFMAMAGYDPHEAVAFWERMAASSKGQSKPPAFLSTHPADQKRIDDLNRSMTSPAKKSPGRIFDSIVRGSISFRLMPPWVTVALAIGSVPITHSGSFLSTPASCRRLSAESCPACASPSQWARRQMRRANCRGRRSDRILAMAFLG